MKNLLDTHTVLWLAANSPRLTERARKTIFNFENTSCVSIVSAWEIAIKISLGKMRLNDGIKEFFRITDEFGLEILPIKDDYIKRIENLPFHHRDPFDRMLIVTSEIEGIPLISADTQFHLYDISVIW